MAEQAQVGGRTSSARQCGRCGADVRDPAQHDGDRGDQSPKIDEYNPNSARNGSPATDAVVDALLHEDRHLSSIAAVSTHSSSKSERAPPSGAAPSMSRRPKGRACFDPVGRTVGNRSRSRFSGVGVLRLKGEQPICAPSCNSEGTPANGRSAAALALDCGRARRHAAVTADHHHDRAVPEGVIGCDCHAFEVVCVAVCRQNLDCSGAQLAISSRVSAIRDDRGRRPSAPLVRPG